MSLVAALLGATTAWSPARAHAQDTIPRIDTTAALRPPTRRDSIPGWPYNARGVVPTANAEVPPGPLPPGSRYRFSRDSIPWSTAQTLADLLSAIPGVYVARAGFLGLPEYVAYAGRGAAGLEVYWDGVPLEPLGSDSIHTDPGRIPLNYLHQVDVEVLPGTLRVYLVSERHERIEPRSVVRVMSGSFRTASYTGLFQKRWAQGFGLNLAANFLGTEGGSGQGRSDHAFDVWAKLEWHSTPTTGAVYQFRRQEYDRDAVTTGREAPPIPVTERLAARDGTRSDFLFSLYTGVRPFGRGLRLDGGLGTSAWTDDTIVGDQRIRQAFAGARYQAAAWNAEVRGRVADSRTTAAVEARAGWIPLRGLVLSGDARWRRHEGGRESRAAHIAAALYRGPVSLSGELAVGETVQAPALPLDTAQETVDRSVRLAITTRPLSGHVSLVERDAFRPLPFTELAVLPAASSSTKGTYLVAAVKLQPVSALALDGWYADPLTGSADFQPPRHSRAQLTLRSKFWRTFRSGAFDLKIQFALESWGDGIAGRTQTGAPILLEGVTYQEWLVAFQVVGFTAFWNLRDAALARRQYVPGLSYPHNAQVFGVRWEFTN